MTSGVISGQFLFTAPQPFKSCHAATLVEAGDGRLLCAYFGGTREGQPDVRVWLSERAADGRWADPRPVADGRSPDGAEPQPTWNPVLFRPSAGPLVLYYKVGPSPSRWRGMAKTSPDDGRTWSDPHPMPEGIVGPAKNKPVQLPDGDVIAPSSIESAEGWRVCFPRSRDGGLTWLPAEPVPQEPGLKATQPTLLDHGGGTIQALGRTTAGRLFETWSRDAGLTWSGLQLTDLPNCNSGIDAVTLRDGRHVLVYNHSNLEKVRYPLNVAVSEDGRRWFAAAVLEDQPPGQYSYPAVIQTADGLVHVAYTWKRRSIRHVTLDPDRLTLRPIETFACPPPGSPTHRVDEEQ